MKPYLAMIFLLTGLVFCSTSGVGAQTLEVAWDKTTMVIFESPIQSIDRGSRFLLGMQDEKALNMLKLKAGSKDLAETTLHVLTADGKVHEFQVRYSEQPHKTIWDLRGVGIPSEKVIQRFDLDQENLDTWAAQLASTPNRVELKLRKYRLEFTLREIYYEDGLLLFELGLTNSSTIPMVIQGPEFWIQDGKSSKLSSLRQEKIDPVLTTLYPKSIVSVGQSSTLLFAFPVFTIANSKKLYIRLAEPSGDRELTLRLNGKKLLQAQSLPMFHTKPTAAYGSGEL